MGFEVGSWLWRWKPKPIQRNSVPAMLFGLFVFAPNKEVVSCVLLILLFFVYHITLKAVSFYHIHLPEVTSETICHCNDVRPSTPSLSFHHCRTRFTNCLCLKISYLLKWVTPNFAPPGYQREIISMAVKNQWVLRSIGI